MISSIKYHFVITSNNQVKKKQRRQRCQQHTLNNSMKILNTFFGFCSRFAVRGKVRLSEEAETMPDGLHQPATIHARENICQDALPRRRDEGEARNDDQPPRGQNPGTKHTV